jgi:hypothetical protein
MSIYLIYKTYEIRLKESVHHTYQENIDDTPENTEDGGSNDKVVRNGRLKVPIG